MRRGAITIFVLVCLLLITAICGVLLRIGWAEREHVRAEERKLQAEWLVESGLGRAVAKLAAHADYSGEAWEVSPDDLGGSHPARATITVESIADQPRKRRVRVSADYPSDSTSRARLSKEVSVETASKAKEEES
jgi:hypothetical protein